MGFSVNGDGNNGGGNVDGEGRGEGGLVEEADGAAVGHAFGLRRTSGEIRFGEGGQEGVTKTVAAKC